MATNMENKMRSFAKSDLKIFKRKEEEVREEPLKSVDRAEVHACMKAIHTWLDCGYDGAYRTIYYKVKKMNPPVKSVLPAKFSKRQMAYTLLNVYRADVNEFTKMNFLKLGLKQFIDAPYISQQAVAHSSDEESDEVDASVVFANKRYTEETIEWYLAIQYYRATKEWNCTFCEPSCELANYGFCSVEYDPKWITKYDTWVRGCSKWLCNPTSKNFRSAKNASRVFVDQIIVHKPLNLIDYFEKMEEPESLYEACAVMGKLELRSVVHFDKFKQSMMFALLHKFLISEVPVAHAGISEENAVTQEQNTTFSDQREVVRDEGYITSQLETTLQNLTMAEPEWRVRDVYAKPIPFWTGTWSTGDERNKVLKSWRVPEELMIGPHYNISATFTFWRGHPKVRGALNASKFHVGKVALMFIPYLPGYDPNSANWDFFSPDTAMSAPHVMLDAGISNSGEISLPFCHLLSYFNTVDYQREYTLGTLVLYVFNQLRAPSTLSQTVSISLFISYDNAEAHQPCHAHVPFDYPKAHAGAEGLIKGGMNLLTDLAAPEMQMVGNVAGAAANFDKPDDPVELRRWVPNVVSNLCYGEGINESTRLGLIPGSFTIPEAQLVSTTEDDMNLNYLCKIPSRIVVKEWTTSTAEKTELVRIPVYPCYCEKIVPTGVTPEVDSFNISNLAYWARMNKFWRGSLHYRVEFLVSQMHSGRAMIKYSAGIENSTFEQATYVNTEIVDLQERHAVEFTVPFMHVAPWLRCDQLTDKLTQGGGFHHQFVGSVQIFVLNRLVAPDTASSTVDVNVFVSAGPDFELAVPCDLSGCTGSGKPKAKAHSGQETVPERTDQNIDFIGKGSTVSRNVARCTMSENAMNLKSVIRRPSLVYSFAAKSLAKGFLLGFPNLPTLSQLNDSFGDQGRDGIQSRSILSHVSQRFSFWRGSISYKIVFNMEGDQLVTVFHIPSCYSKPFMKGMDPWNAAVTLPKQLAAFSNYGTIMASNKVQGSVEFTVPFFQEYCQLSTDAIGDTPPTARNATGMVYVWVHTYGEHAGQMAQIDLYHSAGDDFELNYLRPPMYLSFYKTWEDSRQMAADAVLYGDLKPSAPVPDEEEKAAAHAGRMNEVPESPPITPSTSDGNIRTEISSDVKTEVELEAKESLEAAGDSEDEDEEFVTPEEESPSTLLQFIGNYLKPTALSKAEVAMDEVTTTAKNVNSKVDAFGEVVTSSMNYMTDLVRSIVEQLKMKFEGFASVEGLISSGLSIVSAIHSYMSASSVTMKVIAVTAVIRGLFGPKLYDYVSRAAGYVYEMIGRGRNEVDERPRGQTGEDESEEEPSAKLFKLVATIVAAFGGALALKYKINSFTSASMRELSERLRLFNFGVSACTNLAKVRDAIEGMFKCVMDFILQRCSPRLYSTIQLKDGFEDLEAWVLEVEAAYDGYQDHLVWDGYFRRKVAVMFDRMREYQRLVKESQMGLKARVLLKTFRKVVEMYNYLIGEIPKLEWRVDPYVITLSGPTRIGKSAICDRLVDTCMDRLGYGKTKRTCAINCVDEYFTENYENFNTHVYIDDFAAFATEDQYHNFFLLKSNRKYAPNFAFKKGRYFNSEVISMTTNHPYPAPNCIADQGAFLARRNALIEMEWADKSKRGILQPENTPKPIDGSHALFRFLQPFGSRDASPFYSFDEMVEKLIARMNDHFHNQYTLLAHKHAEEAMRTTGAAHYDESQWDVDFEGMNDDVEMGLCGMNEQIHKLEFIEDQHGRVAVSPDSKLDEDEWEYINPLLASKEFYDGLQKYVKRKQTKYSSLKASLCGLKQWMKDRITTLFSKENLDWLVKKVVACKNTLIVANLILLSGLLGNWAMKTTVRCVCRYAIYRCVLCGRWPDLAKATEQVKEFVMSQWEYMYGAVKYLAGKITTLEEEVEICRAMGMPSPGVILAGTALAQAGKPYGGYEGRHPTVSKVIAHNDRQAMELIENRISKSIYRIKTSAGITQSVLAVGDRKVITPNHFWTEVKDGDSFYLMMGGQWIPFEYQQRNKIVIHEKDLCIMDLGPRFPQHKDLTKHFVSEKDLEFCLESHVMLVKKQADGVVTHVESRATGRGPTKYYLDVNGEEQEVQCLDSWTYPIQCRPGDCGSPLVIMKEAVQSGKILGIHVAGTTSRSFAILVTKEQLMPNVRESVGIPLPETKSGDTYLVPQGHFLKLGKAVDGGVFLPNKTKLLPTPMHDEIFPHETEPAVLNSRDPRLDVIPSYPLTKGIAKYGKVLTPFPSDIVEIMKEYTAEEFKKFRPLRKLDRLLTESEIVFGIDGLPFYDRMNMKSSPGYPWVKERKMDDSYDFENSGKRYLFDEVNLCIRNKKLKKIFDIRDAEARKGNRVCSVWVDCLKDERRAIEKIKSASTRVFTVPPVDFTIFARKYILDFAAAMKSSYATSWCQVGINPESLDWDNLYHRLRGFSQFAIAGDFAQFDGTVPPELNEVTKHAVKAWVIEWYKFETLEEQEEFLRALDVIFDELCHTVTLARDELYMTMQGNPSGNIITDLYNSGVDANYLLAAWILLAREFMPDMATIAAFRKHVRFVVYGDDNVLMVKGNVLKWFNQETIADVLSRYSITYTNDNKTGVTAYKDLDECTFLKRGFGVHEELKVRVPLMARRTCQELTNWYRKGENDRLQLQENFNDALRFMYFYGKKEFTEFRAKLSRSAMDHDLEMDLLDFSTLDYEFKLNNGFLSKAHSLNEEFVSKQLASLKETLSPQNYKTIENIHKKLLKLQKLQQSDRGLQCPADPSGENSTKASKKRPRLAKV